MLLIYVHMYQRVCVCVCVRAIMCVGFFYFLLNNLPPTMRSQTNSIQLVAIVKRKLIDKYSMKLILQPIITDLKKLVRLCVGIYSEVYPYVCY